MYDINAGNARPEMAEVGKGSNQLADYKPVERAIEADAAMQERKAAAKKKADEARQEQVYNALSSIDAKAVKPNDVTYFSDKIQSLYNDAAKKMNLAGEITPQDRNALEASIAQIKAEAAASGNTKSFVQGELTRAYAAPPGTYRDEDIKKLEDRIASPEHVKNWDTGDLRLNVNKNLQEDINKTILPAREKLAVEGSVEFPTASGSIIKIDKKDLSPEIEQNLYNDWVSNNYEQLSYDLRKKQARGDKEAISYGNDVNQYADKVYKPQFSLHEEKRGYQRPLQGEGEGSGETGADAIDNTPSTYKMTTPSTTGAPVDATATSIANGRLGKNISKNLTLTTDIRDINGNSLPFAKGVYPTSGSDVKVMAVYKKGAKGVSGDLSGSIIPDGRIDNAIKAGVIEYQPIFMGKMTVPDIDETTGKQKTYINTIGVKIPLTKEISITAPARLLKGGLGKSEKTFDELNRIAEEKNATIKGAPKAAASSAAAPKAYTRAELKAMSPSYTDAVIDAGVKSGKIKLK